ncbi:MAG TPA: FAD-dependent oxidoreductase [Gemmatimonadota bacterium]|nr:FAD-dependent oxidoreductase [Gemmatimonadota bacterium]
MAEPHVLIVGAGPTGLALALWLTRAGIPVRIIDRAAEPGTTSRALAVQVRTLEYYRQLGIAEAVIEEGVKIAGINFWVRGARAARVPFKDLGKGLTPYSFVLIYPQDAHERLLIEKLGALGVRVERRTELIRFDQQENGVRAAIRRPNGTEELWEAAYLVGCDGASSDIRERLAIGFPGGTYTGLFYVADVEASGPPTNGEIHVDLEEADFALVFPLKSSGHVRVVGTVQELGDGGRSAPTFEDVRGRAIENLKLEVLGVNWFSTYRVHHRVAARFRDRRVFLLGDAAHIHSPVGGQGMNTGIGDAFNLAWKLAAVLKEGAGDSLLDTYEAERIGFARRLVATTDRIFTIVTKRGTVARFVRTRVAPILAPRLFQLSAMRRFLFRTVSQTGIEYRQSALSAGRAGAVHGGDRLPWVETAPGEDNFAPLASLEWQVHVYGKPPPGLLETCAEIGLPFHVFAWRPSMARAGFDEGALYLVRPDGHVGLADPQADSRRLRSYFDTHVSLLKKKNHG